MTRLEAERALLRQSRDVPILRTGKPHPKMVFPVTVKKFEEAR